MSPPQHHCLDDILSHSPFFFQINAIIQAQETLATLLQTRDNLLSVQDKKCRRPSTIAFDDVLTRGDPDDEACGLRLGLPKPKFNRSFTSVTQLGVSNPLHSGFPRQRLAAGNSKKCLKIGEEGIGVEL